MGTMLTVGAIALYLFIAIRFWQRFDRTCYSQSRFLLSALWLPLLVNRSYRENFRRALLG